MAMKHVLLFFILLALGVAALAQDSPDEQPGYWVRVRARRLARQNHTDTSEWMYRYYDRLAHRLAGNQRYANAIKYDVLQMLRGDFPIFYERRINRTVSIYGGVGLTKRDFLYKLNTALDQVFHGEMMVTSKPRRRASAPVLE